MSQVVNLMETRSFYTNQKCIYIFRVRGLASLEDRAAADPCALVRNTSRTVDAVDMLP